MGAAGLRALRPAELAGLLIEGVARVAGTGAVQVAPAVLAGDRAGVDAGPVLVADKLREALADARRAAEAVAAVIRRGLRAVRHTFVGVAVTSVAQATDLDAVVEDGGAIAARRSILLGLKKHSPVIEKSLKSLSWASPCNYLYCSSLGKTQIN